MEIILYSTHCPKCKVLTLKLDKKHIPYTVETSVDKMLALGLKTAPALSVDGTIMPFAEANAWVNNQKDWEN